MQHYITLLAAEKLAGKWPPLPPRTPHILSYNRGNLLRGQISCTHDDCGYLRVILRSWACLLAILRARNSAHSHNLLIYISYIYSFAEASQVHSKSAAASNQKGQGKAGESATLSPKIPGNHPTPVSTSFCQSLPLISSYSRGVFS